jgi:hypothetical protein
VKYRLHSRNSFGIFADAVAGIHVSIESRIITAGDIDANAVAFPEQLADVS